MGNAAPHPACRQRSIQDMPLAGGCPEHLLYPGIRALCGWRQDWAVDDNLRLTRFIYRNLHRITEICPTLDTHQAMQMFHGIFLVNDKGEHPAPYTLISEDDILRGAWKFNPSVAKPWGSQNPGGNTTCKHYVRRLKESGRYDLTVWPYHAMLGGSVTPLFRPSRKPSFSMPRRDTARPILKSRDITLSQRTILFSALKCWKTAKESRSHGRIPL